MSEELKACPFCGQTNISIEYDGIYRWAECRNTKCETTGKIHAFLVDAGNTEYLVAKEWNTRPIEDQLRAENEKLKEALKYIVDRGYTGASYVAQQALKEVKG